MLLVVGGDWSVGDWFAGGDWFVGEIGDWFVG